MRTYIQGLVRIGVSALLSYILWLLTVHFSPRSDESIESTLLLLLFAVIAAVIWYILLGRFLINWVGELVGRLWLPSDESFDWQPQYSIAEARVKEGLYVEAVVKYRDYMETYPEEITPHMRIADICLQHLGAPQEAIMEIQAALPKARTAETFSLVNFRLADLYMKVRNDPQSALACLREIQSRHPGTRHAKAALERASALMDRARRAGSLSREG